MNRHLIIACVSLGLAACTAGCQNSGTDETSVDDTRPTTPAPAAAPAAGAAQTSTYGVAYVTTADTPWMRSSTDGTAAGTLRTGEVVYLRSDAPTTGIVAARTSDGRVIYVRAADLRKQ